MVWQQHIDEVDEGLSFIITGLRQEARWHEGRAFTEQRRSKDESQRPAGTCFEIVDTAPALSEARRLGHDQGSNGAWCLISVHSSGMRNSRASEGTTASSGSRAHT